MHDPHRQWKSIFRLLFRWSLNKCGVSWSSVGNVSAHAAHSHVLTWESRRFRPAIELVASAFSGTCASAPGAGLASEKEDKGGREGGVETSVLPVVTIGSTVVRCDCAGGGGVCVGAEGRGCEAAAAGAAVEAPVAGGGAAV